MAQNNSPAEICPDNSSLSPNYTYIGSKDAGPGPATFKPIFKAIGPKLELSGQISAGGAAFLNRLKNRHRNRRVLYIVDAHDIHTRARVCTRTTCTCMYSTYIHMYVPVPVQHLCTTHIGGTGTCRMKLTTLRGKRIDEIFHVCIF